jgi:hypothetical protein
MKPSHKSIKKQFTEFSTLKNYKEKLLYFDQLFGIIPITFPPFHHKLKILFDHTEIEVLSKIYESERISKNHLLKEFAFNNEKYLFDVTPETPQRQILNDFILNKILDSDSAISVYVHNVKFDINNNACVEDYLSESFNLINLIKNRKGRLTERSYINQFMNVFYQGYQDSQNKFIQKFTSKKKFIELYLYAQGILFNKYVEQINTENIISNSPVKTENINSKLLLLEKLGIIDLLRYRYNYMDKKDLHKHLAETISKITGDSVTKLIVELNKLQLVIAISIFSMENFLPGSNEVATSFTEMF